MHFCSSVQCRASSWQWNHTRIAKCVIVFLSPISDEEDETAIDDDNDDTTPLKRDRVRRQAQQLNVVEVGVVVDNGLLQQ